MIEVRKLGGHQRLTTLLVFIAISVAVFFGVRACQQARHPAPHASKP